MEAAYLEETGAVRQRHLSQPEAELQWHSDWNSQLSELQKGEASKLGRNYYIF